MVTKIGLDLGYANIVLCDSIAEIYREPSVALVYKEARPDTGRVIAVGDDAMNADVGGGAEGGMLVRPFKNGLLFDQQITREVITHAVRAVMPSDSIRCVIGVPSDFSARNEKDLFSMLESAGVKHSLAVSRPLAAIVGAGYSPSMSVISVNIGARSTEVAVMHSGKVILSRRAEIGGEDFDRAVKDYILSQGEVNISLIVARAIKERLGAVWKGRPNDSLDIEGTLSLTGNKLKVNITTEDIVGVFEPPLKLLIMAIAETVKQIPPEAVEAVFSNGIVLTGGGAELYGIDTLISKVLGISVTRPQNPMDCVALGLARINAFLPARMKAENKNITEQVSKYYESSKNAKGV